MSMPKVALFTIALIVITLTVALTLIFNDNLQKQPPRSQIDTAIAQAKFLYRQRKDEGVNFLSGPCLSNALIPGWVVDVAHSPRINIDDLPENQCPAYLEGRADHFVELDPEGNLIRAR